MTQNDENNLIDIDKSRFLKKLKLLFLFYFYIMFTYVFKFSK